MSEFSLSTTNAKKSHLSSLLLSDLFVFCSLIVSHPLYFSYFIFFSPYLLKLLSFLSPLFVTTSLLLLALLTFSPFNFVHDSTGSFVFSSYQAVVEKLRSKAEDGHEEIGQFEDSEVYKIVFDISNLDIGGISTGVSESDVKESNLSSNEAEVYKSSSHEDSTLGACKASNFKLAENQVVITKPESAQLTAEVQTLQGFLHQSDEAEDLWYQKGDKEVKPPSVKYNKAEEQKQEKPSLRRESKAMGSKISDVEVSANEEYTPRTYSKRLEANPWSPESNYLGSFGSMRKDKEWRRTLACKLFEERHNVEGGGEGMDLLWETYETDAAKVEAAKSKAKKKGYYNDDDDDAEDENDGQLCCLQALKFSAGKMNLGMGRPNLVKISKALKGIGWLHNVSRHGKKVYH